jgi:hypothetical protein
MCNQAAIRVRGKDRGQHGEGLTSAIEVPFYVGVVMPA